ncbi:MAG: hypothetical protein RRC07_14825, partial [Anaerolineae bacterium]|nr:hypothetical protein [Anaerolineae bacterium]
MSLVNLIVGLATLLLGRQLFWLFVAAAGFVLGFNLARQFLGPEVTWVVTLVGLFVGLLGAFLATFAQRLAIAIAGFITGAYLLNLLAASLGLAAAADPFAGGNVVISLIGGVIGAVLVSIFFDAALIFLSALLGATLTTQVVAGYFALGGTPAALLYIVLLVIGIGVQWSVWRE